MWLAKYVIDSKKRTGKVTLCNMCTRKVSRVHQDLVEIIEEVAKIKDIQNIYYIVDFGYDDVDSFASGLQKVTICGTRRGVKIKIKVLVKWHSKPEDRACFREAYKREFVIYNYIEPIYLEIQRNLIPIEGLRYKFPNCVLSSIENEKEAIVLCFCPRFKLFNRFQRMDFHHMSLVVKKIATLHALSFAANILYPEKLKVIQNTLSKDVQYSDIDTIPKSLICYFNASVSVISDPVFKSKLLQISPHIYVILNKLSSPISNHNVICHGDCWNNNILFKYQGSKPVEAVFVDYQLARFASPVTDISYFFYLSTDYEFLSRHYDQLLEIYYGTISAVLRQCNIPIETTFPRHVFEDHLKEYSVMGLVEALISMKIITAGSEEAQKMTEIKHQMSNSLYEYETQNQRMFVERVNGIVKFFFERNYKLDGAFSH